MTSLTRMLVAGATVVAAMLGMTQAAFADPKVPAAIAVPEGNKLYLKAHSVGVQIYSCDGTAWTFVAPRADLLDRRGKLLGTHFAGPTWQATDSSKVVAARVNGVSVDPTAIDWLLLSATSTAEGPRHGDLLSDTTYIQRVNTTGGLIPPAADCNPSTSGTVEEVPYTADYHFWKARHRCKDR